MANERWRKRLVGNRALSPETLMMGYGTIRSCPKPRGVRKISHRLVCAAAPIEGYALTHPPL